MGFTRPKLLVTGSSGLIGSALVRHFDDCGWAVFGIDNNMRADFFGPKGDTRWNQHLLESQCGNFRHCEVDIRDRGAVERLIREIRPGFVAHAAAQPSHDLAATRPFDDFDVNASGTLNLLEACRLHCPEAPFAFMSTNKVYGDGPNRLPLLELDTRYDYASDQFSKGIREDFPVDQCMHSLFGASKLAADVMVQEYGRYFGMPTCVLRGGCLTGPSHSGVELHGFMSYLVKVNIEGGNYRVFGYRGKQVRDNIHAADVAHFIECFFERPRTAEVYNIGGGRNNSCSILEAFDAVSSLSGKPMHWEYVEENRKGDHICYISDLSKMREHYPNWNIQKSLEDIYVEIVRAWSERLRTA